MKKALKNNSKKTKKRTLSLLLIATVATASGICQPCAESTSAAKAKSKTSSKEETTTATLSAAGDCTLASDIKQPQGYGFPNMYGKKGAGYFLSGVKKIFANDDLTLVNLEGTLSKRGKRVDKKWAFRGKPKYVKVLKKGSVEAVSFSNNHAFDYGKVSHKDTIKILKKNDIAYSANTKTTVKTVNGIRIGLVSVCSLSSNYGAVGILKRAMKKIKKKKPDAIVVSMHSGIEHTQTLAPVQKLLAKTAIDKGASLVLGHHPHVIQGLDRYKGRYIAYSLGNFCFGGNTNPDDKDTFIFQMTFEKKNGKVKCTNPKVIPARLSSVNYRNNYHPVISKGKRKASCIKRLNKYSLHGVRVKKDGSVWKQSKKKHNKK